ncbi:hypothetical protein Pm5461_108 [Proteus phage vB_PmiM_Pm5461]|uniref:Phage protein n=1 Tax=Proteus phage vB_PmiM_Pm5461 TaxID=1636250 RepID=A0A0G2SS61_9CAUD|nr:hypothetical protein AVT59_gp111 [Proteus phage vB_PmiM_Pm5461]AKA61973.1 hypothetical protein Pm5461_108 [Proteus phage vB_PmiM_Pm5461]
MKLQRNSINVQNSRGVWYFSIIDNNPELLEKVDNLLRAEETPNYSDEDTWDGYCDQCSDYNGGVGVGYWIPTDQVDDFKESWKKIKKLVK